MSISLPTKGWSYPISSSFALALIMPSGSRWGSSLWGSSLWCWHPVPGWPSTLSHVSCHLPREGILQRRSCPISSSFALALNHAQWVMLRFITLMLASCPWMIEHSVTRLMSFSALLSPPSLFLTPPSSSALCVAPSLGLVSFLKPYSTRKSLAWVRILCLPATQMSR